jgi:membrane-bound lytic murein transglycosylase D
MTDRRSPYPWFLVVATSVLATFAGCAPVKQLTFRTPLPPAAAATAEGIPLSAGSPPAEVAAYGNEPPEFLKESARSLPQSSVVAPFLRRVDTRFEAGRRFYRAGDMGAARREFDRAVETLLNAPRNAADGETLERKLSELVDAIHGYDISGLGAGLPDSETVFDKPPLEEIPEPTFPIDPKLRNRVTEELKTTVSQLPLELNDEVLRYINFFSSGSGRKILLSGLRQAGRYRPLIYRILDEEGMPQELIHMAQAESGFAPRAVSRMKAAGMWQFISSRGQEYGLLGTKTTDDRLDPEKATRAAARHLRDLYTEFGDWYLAMAAYNCGPVNVERAVARTGYADFWELKRRNMLPKETANYVPIILAMAIMSKNPAHYGLEGIEVQPPLEYSTVGLEGATHLDLIADITGQPVAEIRVLNPALLTNVAPAGYALHVPAGGGANVVSALDLVPAEGRATWRLHRVTEGDTLEAIARRYRTTTQRIAVENPTGVADLSAGSLLIVPATPELPKPAAKARVASVRRPARPTTKAAAPPPARSARSARHAVARQTSKPKAQNAKSPLVASKKASLSRQASGATR